MYKVDSINNYSYSDNLFSSLADEIYNLTVHLKNIYPNYKEWFYNKQIKGCLNKKRNIFFIKDNNKIIAVCSVKKDISEKKICTLYVKEEYRLDGIGSIVIEEAFKYLKTKKPVITFTEDKLFMFEKMILKYNWVLTKIIDNINNSGLREFCYNDKEK